MRSPASRQFLRFLVVGGINAALNATVFFVLVYLGVHYILASAAGVILGIINSFVLNRHFTFVGARDRSAAPQVLGTFMTYAVQIAVSWCTLYVLIDILKLPIPLAYILSTGLVTAVSYIGLSRVFGARLT